MLTYILGLFNKTCVYFAARVLSVLVAAMYECILSIGSHVTIKFIQNIDKLFDILIFQKCQIANAICKRHLKIQH